MTVVCFTMVLITEQSHSRKTEFCGSVQLKLQTENEPNSRWVAALCVVKCALLCSTMFTELMHYACNFLMRSHSCT